MRTTLDIPNDLFRRAKANASLSGISLKQFITNAIKRELELSSELKPKGRRVVLPLVPSKRPSSIHLTGNDVANLLEGEDLHVSTRR